MIKLLAFIVLVFSLLSVSSASAAPGIDPLADQAASTLKGSFDISYDGATGQVRFLRARGGAAGIAPSGAGASSPEAGAKDFVNAYGRAFGINAPDKELKVGKQKTVRQGSIVRFQQLREGIPVFGGELIVRMNASGRVTGANAKMAPNSMVDISPAIDAERAKAEALALAGKLFSNEREALQATAPELMIYNSALFGRGENVNMLVWKLEVRASDNSPVRELVLVNARTGKVVLHFSQIKEVKNRRVFDNNNSPAPGLPGSGPVRIEGEGPTGRTDVDSAYDYSGDTYDFYSTRHGRDSIDNLGMALRSTVRYCASKRECPFAGAYWNGTQMVFGEGFVADDIVAHEITHAVTERESGLVYFMQPGAINESFSDMWGEFVDLTNGKGNDDAAVRWLIGEDTLQGATGSMSDPTLFGDPDRMGSPNYSCSVTDNGGVHRNSGVNNKAVYLMTDGDTFNGITVSGIGIDKVAALYYEVQTGYLTSSSGYADLYDSLLAACDALALAGTAGIGAADCVEVKNALDAVEMSQSPSGCAVAAAPICDSGRPFHLFFDSFETPAVNWIVQEALNNSLIPIWGISEAYASGGSRSMWAWNADAKSDTSMSSIRSYAIPAAAMMHFNHSYMFETSYDANGIPTYYDGGVLEYSTDGGANWVDAGALFTHNGYDGAIATGTNQLAGRNAFTETNGRFVPSRLDLSTLAGENVMLRFRVGTDRFIGSRGWFIDDIRIYTCDTVSGPRFGTYRDGIWLIDENSDLIWTEKDDTRIVLGTVGERPVSGDFNQDGVTDYGVFRNGKWRIDTNGDGIADLTYTFGQTGDVPVTGDWDNDGRTEIGVFRKGVWLLDMDGDGVYNNVFDAKGTFGVAGDIPITGDWDGNGRTKVGVFRSGNWLLDMDGDLKWEPAGGDKKISLGAAGDRPVTGDWNGDGKTDIGVFKSGSAKWVLDVGADGSIDSVFVFGSEGDKPIVVK